MNTQSANLVVSQQSLTFTPVLAHTCTNKYINNILGLVGKLFSNIEQLNNYLSRQHYELGISPLAYKDNTGDTLVQVFLPNNETVWWPVKVANNGFMLQSLDVDCYFNLHKYVFSIRSTGAKPRVIAHHSALALTNASFRVSEAGRQRVIATRRKNVHALVRGQIIATEQDARNKLDQARLAGCFDITRVTYNPYKCSHFYIAGTEQYGLYTAPKLIKSSILILVDKQIWLIY